MTQRRRLDAFLVEQAVAAGAELRDGVRVEAIEPSETGVAARIGGATVRAGALVGADGANGVVARTIGVDDAIVRGVALEGNIPLEALAPRDLERTAVIELAALPGGYGWVFPKGDHANLGVGGWGSEGPRLRDHLARLARAHGVDPEALTELRGHRLPMRRLGTPAGAGRTLLVGDAAGLVDPLSGDGMYEAFVSARLAADAIVAGDLDGYTAALSARSTGTPPPRGPRSARSTATRAPSSRPHARRGCSRSSPGCSAATSRTRPTRAASRAARSS